MARDPACGIGPPAQPCGATAVHVIAVHAHRDVWDSAPPIAGVVLLCEEHRGWIGQDTEPLDVEGSGTDANESMVVTVTPTINSGWVVRWFGSEQAAEHREPMLSASRAGVCVSCYLHQVPADVLATATQAYETLRDGREEGILALATHRKRGLFGPLVPVERAPSTPDGGGRDGD